MSLKRPPTSFPAHLKKIGIYPCVDAPASVSRLFGKRGYIPVKGFLNKTAVKATLVPIGDGRHRFFVNGDMMKRAGVKVGDTITLRLAIDASDRTQVVPTELRAGLKGNAKARATWARLSVSKKKEISRTVANRKTAEVRQRNAARAIRALASAGRVSFGAIKIPPPSSPVV